MTTTTKTPKTWEAKERANELAINANNAKKSLLALGFRRIAVYSSGPARGSDWLRDSDQMTATITVRDMNRITFYEKCEGGGRNRCDGNTTMALMFQALAKLNV